MCNNKKVSMALKPGGKWPSRPFQLLYSGYIFSCVGDRLWTFAIVLLLEHLGGMRLVSANQLVDGVSAMLLSTFVGNWLDRHDRKVGALTVLAVNNICVAGSASLLAICLTLHMSVLCAVSKCASEGQKMAFTKDWIVVMANREQSDSLSRRNATMTTIDQLSSVIAPLITGYILLFGGYRLACLVFVAWNFVSWAAERYLLSKVYSQVDELAVRERNVQDMSDPQFKEEIDILLKKESSASKSNSASMGVKFVRCWRRLERRTGKALSAYRRQQVFFAAIGLALLYMTVLGFDGLALSYGKSQYLPDNVLGAFRSVGSVLGICGALSYTLFERRIGVRNTGFLGLSIQQLFLWLCLVSIWLPGSPFNPSGYARSWTFEGWIRSSANAFSGSRIEDPTAAGRTLSPLRNESLTSTEILPSKIITNTEGSINWSDWTIDGHPVVSIVVFFCGITFARLGLWMADLSITQLMQESIAEEERNTVFGAQNAFCQLFSVLKDIVVILFPDPRTFGLLIAMSVGFVTLGFFSYCCYLFKIRRYGSNSKSSQINLSSQAKPLPDDMDQEEKAKLLPLSPSAPFLTPTPSVKSHNCIEITNELPPSSPS
ncbi:ferroportin1 (FPN1) domain-containing protein [Ditylenchus destructor]|nr:ferroportin1 (FPN1) domain-containing protein [Ditylenchus destructor]